MELSENQRIGWIKHNMPWSDKFSGYMMKHFAERFTAAKHLAENNKDIKKYSMKVHELLIPVKNPNAQTSENTSPLTVTIPSSDANPNADLLPDLELLGKKEETK